MRAVGVGVGGGLGSGGFSLLRDGAGLGPRLVAGGLGEGSAVLEGLGRGDCGGSLGAD
ncbi:hypothetical protein [Streptomyces mutabilis]|uniref:hypothetical protein n=1 Tax=Streptomyces mutabilis TaxID=67332 RepID=UPI0012B69D9F|nr:hypothetical protein [Streptomyces mutabilis]